MALSLGRNKSHGSVGLDVDGAFLAAVQTSGSSISNAASVDLAPGLIVDGEVADVAGLSEALKAFFKDNNLPRKVRLGVSNQQIVVRHLEIPNIPNEDERAAAVRFQADEAIPMSLDEAVLDYQMVAETVSLEGIPRMRVVVVAAREAMIERLVEAARGAGLTPEGVDLSAFALVRTLAPGMPAESARVYCHLGGVINLAVASGSTCLFTRPLSTNWEDDAENAVISLAEEIRLSIDFYMAQPDAPPVGGVLLSGPGSKNPGLSGELSGLIGIPVSLAEPLGGLSGAALPEHEDPYRHTVAVGLALGAAA